MKFYFSTLIVLLSLSCNTEASKDSPSQADTEITKTDTLLKQNITTEDLEEEQRKLADSNSYYLNLILDKVLQTSKKYKNRNLYSGSIDTSVYHFRNVHATFLVGNVFSKDRKHLLVKRFINEYGGFGTSLFFDIYTLKENQFKKLISDTANIGYTQDTLEDINADGFKDFIVSQYSGVGCCPRDDRMAYLYNNKNGSFEAVNLFNPEFDYKHNTVYEMDYGYPGEVSIEKSVWKGLTKILVESLSPNHFENRMDSFVKPYSYIKTVYTGEKTIILKDVPNEYKKLNNFEYFISYQK